MGQIESLDVAISTPVIWFTFAISVITGLVIGAYPSWSASPTDTMPALIGFSRQGVSSRFVSKLLIVAQVSLSLALMVSAMLFGSSLGKLRRVNLGYDIDHVATVSIVPRLIKDTPQVGPPMVQLSSNFEDFMAKLRHLPGVEAAAFSFPGVLQGFAMSGPVNALDHTGATIGCSFLMASPDYFSTLRIPLLQGREFAHTDRVGSPMVAILNRRAAALLWPGEAPVGRRFDSVISKAVEVIGVVADTKYQNIREATEPIIYLSAYQMPVMAVSVALRTRLGMTQVERKSQKLLRSTSPSFQISNVTTLDMTRDGLLAQDRLLSLLFSLFGSLGTAMAIVGIYGLIAHAVTTRTHEIGIRMSVGATRSNILTLFLREAFTLLSCGIVIGLLLAGFAGRVAAALLYEIRPTDLGAYAGAVALVLAAGLTSAIVPAVRAMKINPTEALRYE